MTNRQQRRASVARSRCKTNEDGLAPSQVMPTAVLADLFTGPGDGDRISDADRIWFLNNPQRTFRLRPLAETEAAFHERVRPPDKSGRAGFCLVRKIADKHRLRVFFLSRPFRAPERFNEVVCKLLFSALQELNPQIGKIAERVGSIIDESDTTNANRGA